MDLIANLKYETRGNIESFWMIQQVHTNSQAMCLCCYFISFQYGNKKTLGKYTRLMHMFSCPRLGLYSLNPFTKTKLNLDLKNLLSYFQDKVSMIPNQIYYFPSKILSKLQSKLSSKKKEIFLNQMNLYSFSITGGLIQGNSVPVS